MLMIAAGQPSASDAAGLRTGSGGSGDTGTSTASGGGNRVVRILPSASRVRSGSGAGKIRSDSGAGNHVARMYCP